LGDALGFLVEGFPTEECEEYVTGPMQSWLNGKMDDCSIGQYTDDSQLARDLLESIVTCGRFEPADYANRIAAIFADNRVVGRGIATHNAAMRLIDGVSWEESGTPPPTAGNGSAMRAAPIGLFHFDDPHRLVQAAHDQGRITHRDSRCSAGAAAIAGAVALALQSETIEIAEFVDQLAEWVEPLSGEFAEPLRKLAAWHSLPVSEAADQISIAGLESGRTSNWEKISPFVIPSVLWSLFSFLRSPDDYWTTICTAICVGGDVDTTAAMAGAISGARLGIKAIPRHLAERLNDRSTWRYAELCDLAKRLYLLRFPGG
jgi:ADP-ribosylglycohydrolase